MRPGSTHASCLTGLVLTGLLCIGLQSGCAVLTQSQVDEVAAFAKAVDDYGTLPGEPIMLYGQVASVDRMLMVSGRTFADAEASAKAWESIKKAIEVEQAFKRVSSQVDQALSVLTTYSELLTTLSSDDFTDALDKTAADLGKSLDKGVKRYNETFRKPEQREELKRVGSIVAQFVRGGGGLSFGIGRPDCLNSM